jgi:hypothetical protein
MWHSLTVGTRPRLTSGYRVTFTVAKRLGREREIETHSFRRALRCNICPGRAPTRADILAGGPDHEY